jgi:hypothetical protein
MHGKSERERERQRARAREGEKSINIFLKTVMITTALSPFLSCRVECTHTHINECKRVLIVKVTVAVDTVVLLNVKKVISFCFFAQRNFSCPNSSLSGKNTQEVSIQPLSFYMSFELDSCSLRDVIVIGCVRKPAFFLSVYLSPHRNKCSIIAPTRQGEKTNALALKLIRLLPLLISL